MNKPKYQIGNYISTEYGELEIKNTAFGDYQVVGLDGRILWANEINPIPLTDQWLLKFGFTEEMFDYTIHTGEFYNGSIGILLVTTIGVSPKFQLKYEMKCTQTIIQYVHQLQNLYFCLTGEELKINE